MLGYIFLHNNTSHQTPQQSRSFPVWEEVNRNTSAEPSGSPLTWCKARRLGGTPGGWHIRCRPGRCRWPECGSLPSSSAPPTEQEHKVEMSWRFNDQDRLRGRYWPQRSRGPSPGRRCSFLHGPPDPGSRWTPQAFSTVKEKPRKKKDYTTWRGSDSFSKTMQYESVHHLLIRYLRFWDADRRLLVVESPLLPQLHCPKGFQKSKILPEPGTSGPNMQWFNQ